MCVYVCNLQSVAQFLREQAVVLAWEKMHLSCKDFWEGVKYVGKFLCKNPHLYNNENTDFSHAVSHDAY